MKKLNGFMVAALVSAMTACGGSGGGSGGGSDDDSGSGGSGSGGGNNPPVQSDTQAPTITVTGDSSLTLPFGALYEELGATAQDDVDTEVVVNIDGQVDSFTPGVYEISYSALDAAGNQAEAVREVTVQSEKVTLRVSSVGGTQYQLENGDALRCNDAGSVCSMDFEVGESVTIIPSTSSDWEFLRWEICEQVVDDQCLVEMTEDKLIAATAVPLAEPVYHDNVIFLTDDQVAALIDYNESQDSLIFSAGADIADFQVGSVLVANGDIQFMRTVVDIITLTGAPTIIETTRASLDDVIESGTLIFDLEEESSATQPKSRSYLPADAVLKSFDVPNYEIVSNADVSVTASGTMSADFDASILVDYNQDDGLVQARILGRADLDTSVGFSVVGEGSASASQRVDLASFNVASITTPTPVLIPLVFTVEIEPFVELSVSGAVSASLSPNVSANLTGSVGAVWDKGYGWTPLQQLTPTVSADPGADISAELGYDVGAGMEVGMELYDFIGPKLTTKVYGGERARAIPLDANNCNLELHKYLGVNASLGGELEVASYTLDVNTQPLAYERAISITPTNCDEAVPEGPSDLVATAVGSRAVGISWSEGTDDIGVVGYELWRQVGTQPYVKLAETALLEYVDSGLAVGSEYCYFVLAIDGVGNRSDVTSQQMSGACSGVLNDDFTPPTAPQITGLEALTTSTAQLDWSAATDDYGVDGYTVEITSANTGAIYSLGSTEELSLVVQQLNPEAEYCFQVFAYDAAGNVSDPSASECLTMPPASQSQWRMFIGCVGRPFQVEQLVDLNQAVTSNVQVAGSGIDYDGTPLTYLLSGIYSMEEQLNADIVWNFEGSSQVRRDRFAADLGSGDSGVVAMDQIEVTGCNAQIQFVSTDQNNGLPQSNKINSGASSMGKLGPN